MSDEFDEKPSAFKGATERGRLQSLGAAGTKTSQGFSRRYSVFMRLARTLLPLAALCLVVVVFSWNQFNSEQTVPAPQEEKTARAIGKNELLNPHFESVDENGQPFTITAKRALQGQSVEDDMILLEEPVADVSLEEGHRLSVRAEQSAFRQTTKRLLLKGQVEIFHDEGYTLYTQELDVDMNAGTARTDLDVRVEGPRGTLEASGLEADRSAGLLVFKGPATLLLHDIDSGMGAPQL